MRSFVYLEGLTKYMHTIWHINTFTVIYFNRIIIIITAINIFVVSTETRHIIVVINVYLYIYKLGIIHPQSINVCV